MAPSGFMWIIFTSPVLKSRLERTAHRADVARNKFLQLRIGYLYSRSAKSSSNQFVEHTPTFRAISPILFGESCFGHLARKGRFSVCRRSFHAAFSGSGEGGAGFQIKKLCSYAVCPCGSLL